MDRKKQFKRIGILLILAVVVFQLGRQVFMEEEWKARNYVHDQVKSLFSEANDKAQKGYGIKPHAGQKTVLSNRLPKPVIVLIHGLDEPGRVWLNLAPNLAEKGYPVFFMSYPNDQKITASARLFFVALKELGVNPGNHMVIIGHSMGGLVSREMLTDPKIDYAGASASGQVPRVSDLIMVGTPNHGSQLARFRFFMEIRDQAQNLFERNEPWLQGLLDGTGAAGIDLIPGSLFLTVLNSRTHPKGVDLHVIAGIISPWSSQTIQEFVLDLEGRLSDDNYQGIKGLEKALNTINNTIGDGLVTLESAGLENVPLTRVHGSHLTMIRNLTKDSMRIPPAIPVIMEILEE